MDERMETQKRVDMVKKEMVGVRYRHFKGNVYIVTDVAVHSETAEPMVVYKPFNDDGKMDCTWVRPLDMFLSEVDHEKYPDVEQKYRFQRIETSL